MQYSIIVRELDIHRQMSCPQKGKLIPLSEHMRSCHMLYGIRVVLMLFRVLSVATRGNITHKLAVPNVIPTPNLLYSYNRVFSTARMPLQLPPLYPLSFHALAALSVADAPSKYSFYWVPRDSPTVFFTCCIHSFEGARLFYS